MLFNSLDFAIFFPLVFIGYWFIFNNSLKAQNIFLLLASYFFYACWDWRFLFLIFFSTGVNYFFGKGIGKSLEKKRKNLTTIAVIINLVLLGYFKYFNFFIDNFTEIFTLFGASFNVGSFKIILPLGISFYTFQSISYIVDVYREETKPSNDILQFSLFIAFFAQLVSGPIERTNHFLPQISSIRKFDYELASDGMKLILLGLFEKMVIADNCAPIVDLYYNTFDSQTGSTLFFTAVLYSFQIYGDFSGYSHIAIGCAALLGFHLYRNFNYPYLAKNIADFWRRWHISFSVWLRDYIYFPLGGSKRGELIQMRNLILVFLVSGFWHGANWTFFIYGAIHAALYILFIYYRKIFHKKGSKDSLLGDFIAIAGTFIALTLARVFFRAENVYQALGVLKGIFSSTLFSKPDISRLMILLLFGFVILEWMQRDKKHLLDISFIRFKSIRYSLYLGIFISILYFAGSAQTFIYFQF